MPGAALSLKEVNSAMPAIMTACVCPMRRACSLATVTLTLKDSANTRGKAGLEVTLIEQFVSGKSNLSTLRCRETGTIKFASQCASAGT